MSQPTIILWCAIGIALVSGLAETQLPSTAGNPGAADLVVSIAYSLCAFAWVKADARARGTEAPTGSALLAALIIPVGVPVYLIRVHGLRSGLWRSLKALAFVLVTAATYVGAALIPPLLTPAR